MERDEDRPKIRAAGVRDFLAHLDTHSLGLQGRVRALIPQDVQQRMDDCSLLGWISAEDHLASLEAEREVLGVDEALRLTAEFVSQFGNSRFLRSLVRISGLRPGGILRLLPVGFSHLYRNYGKVRLEEIGRDTARVGFSELPELVISSDMYLDDFRAVLLGVLAMTGRKGEVQLASLDCEARYAAYRISWEPSNGT